MKKSFLGHAPLSPSPRIFPATPAAVQPRDGHAVFITDGADGLKFRADVRGLDFGFLRPGQLVLASTCARAARTARRALSKLAGRIYDGECGGLADIQQAVFGKVVKLRTLFRDACQQFMAVLAQHTKERHDKHVIAWTEGNQHVADFITIKLPDVARIDTGSGQGFGLIGNARHPLNGPCDAHKVPACQLLKHSVSNTGCEILNGFSNASERYAQ